LEEIVKYLVLVAIAISSLCTAQEAPSCSQVLHYAERQLPHYGVLREGEGFVYVDLDDAYIHKLISFIQNEGFEEPPYFGAGDLVGAHITVIYPDEMNQLQIEEDGKVVDFTLKTCEVVHPPKWKEIDEAYFIVVDAPALDQIRAKYGLPKRAYDFHITIGVKPQVAS
jgi:hypothetical protein